jgi:autotransporter family porin
MGAIAKDTRKLGGKGGDAEGGAIYNIGTLTVTNSIFVKNFAGGGQGGDGANAADRGGDGGQAVGGITNAGTMTVTSATLIVNDGLGGFPGTGGAVGNEA